jgi:ABC-type uncharacterized transport system ATPase subunit
LGHATLPELTLAENMVLTGDALQSQGAVRTEAARAAAAAVIERFDIKSGGPDVPAATLSGGNLQRFIVGREIVAEPRVLLVNQPTWGVDVGAAAAIRNELIGLRQRGCAVLVVSEDLDELYALCDRLMVIAKGRLSPAVRPGSIGVGELGRWMSGLWPAPAEAAA